MSVALSHDAAQIAANLPALMMAARRVAADVMPGTHGRRQIGQGEAFWQFRPYEAGDPIRRIDWRQSGRSDHLFVRQQEWEAAQTLHIWVGHDAAMRQYGRFERAAILALALAMLVERGQEKIALLASGHKPLRGQAALHRLGNWLLRPSVTASPDLSPELPPELPITPHGRMVFFTDGWHPISIWAQIIGYYHRRQQTGHIIQITSPLEDDFAFQGHVRLRGLFGESPETIPHAGAVRADCQQRLANHRDQLAGLCRSAGWFYSHHRLDHPATPCLLGLYHQLGFGL